MSTKEKHTVHCREGGKVVIDGNRVEVHLPGPIVVQRGQWVKYLTPREEARRSISYATGGNGNRIEAMIEEAFTAVPMVVHAERDE